MERLEIMFSHQKSVKKPFFIWPLQEVLFCQNKSQLLNLQYGHRGPIFDHLKPLERSEIFRRVLKKHVFLYDLPRGSCFANGIILMSFVLNRLCRSAEEYCKFLSCKNEKCSVRIRSMVKLYMKIRIHHVLKMSNINNFENKSGKCNRKMLKLSNY